MYLPSEIKEYRFRFLKFASVVCALKVINLSFVSMLKNNTFFIAKILDVASVLVFNVFKAVSFEDKILCALFVPD